MASDFKYLTTDEYASYDLSVSGVTNVALAEKHISYAEKLIDAYCGAWPKFYHESTGQVDAVSDTLVTASLFDNRHAGYWAVGGLYLYVFDGGGVGAERLITASNTAGQVTLATAISGLDTTSEFVIRQYSAFPRYCDVDAADIPWIPRQVKQAVAAQVAFATQKGSEGAGMWHSDPVLNDRGDLVSESWGSGYSYSRDARRVEGMGQFIAPQAAVHLRGFIWRVGVIGRHRSVYNNG
jgi:hypothetical protein